MEAHVKSRLICCFIIPALLMAETACNRSILTENDRIEILKEFKAPAIKLGTKAAALPDA